MNQQDKSFMITFTTVMSVLVLIGVAIFMIAQLVAKVGVGPMDESRYAAAVVERIQPVARVAVASSSAEADGAAAPVGVGAVSGEEVYKGSCAACHATGVAGAPPVGDENVWGPRFEQGMDTLLSHALDGFNAMPAKGGNASLSEEQVNAAVVFMLENSGMDVAVAAEPAAEPAAAAPAGELDLVQGEEEFNIASAACHITGAAGAPMLTDSASWGTRAQQGLDTLVSHAVNGFNAMPPKGGNMNLTEEQIRNSIGYVLNQAGVELAAAPVAEAAPAAEPAPVAEPAVEPVAEPVAATEPAPIAAPVAAVSVEEVAVLQESVSAVHEDVKAIREALAALREELQQSQAAAPAAEPVVEEPAVEAAPAAKEPPEAAAPAEEKPVVAAEAAAEAPAAMAAVDLERGKQLYNTACVICHDKGIAGAPRFANHEDWAPRIAQGMAVLLDHALHGYKGMPSKGGSLDVADEEVIDAVAYMVETAQ